MNVLLIGSGGREHAIAWKISQKFPIVKALRGAWQCWNWSNRKKRRFRSIDFASVGRFIRKNEVNMLIVGPEAPLVEGIIDYFNDSDKFEGLVTIGPRKVGAMLEGSKDFAKEFMARHNIPTAAYKSFDKHPTKAG